MLSLPFRVVYAPAIEAANKGRQCSGIQAFLVCIHPTRVHISILLPLALLRQVAAGAAGAVAHTVTVRAAAAATAVATLVATTARVAMAASAVSTVSVASTAVMAAVVAAAAAVAAVVAGVASAAVTRRSTRPLSKGRHVVQPRHGRSVQLWHNST